MRNLITALLFFGAVFLLWNWTKTERMQASIPEVSESLTPEAFVKVSAVGWEASAPKARPFVPGEAGEMAVDSQYSGMSPVEAAQAYMEANRTQWNLQDHHDVRHVVMQSPLGSTVKFEFSQDGVPITGMYISIDLGKNNEIRSVENLYRPMERADLKGPMLSADDVSARLSGRYESESSADTPMILFAGHQNAKPEPAYSVSATEVANNGTTRRPVKLLIRASDAQVLDISYERAEFSE